MKNRLTHRHVSIPTTLYEQSTQNSRTINTSLSRYALNAFGLWVGLTRFTVDPKDIRIRSDNGQELPLPRLHAKPSEGEPITRTRISGTAAKFTELEQSAQGSHISIDERLQRCLRLANFLVENGAESPTYISTPADTYTLLWAG